LFTYVKKKLSYERVSHRVSEISSGLYVVDIYLSADAGEIVRGVWEKKPVRQAALRGKSET
jgi:hypothetical protein